MKKVKALISIAFDYAGYELRRKNDNVLRNLPFDMEDSKAAIIRRVSHCTMTSMERVYALISSVDHIIEHDIQGDIVECGVWRGGSMLAVALRLKEKNVENRNLYLYDTFEGMPEPDEHDYSKRSGAAQEKFEETKINADSSKWCHASLEDVQQTMSMADYPEARIKYVKGKVEDTIPDTISDKIAILRLDTDWYASTKHELEQLFPRLVQGGVLIIDDYGHWEGCRKAVDEYFAAHRAHKPLLVRVDYTGRIGIKP